MDAKPWRKHLAKVENRVPTMLVKEELNLLNWLTSNYHRREGVIVDAGCFLGGSTMALASGLAEKPAGGVIHSYDLFSTVGTWHDVTFSRFDLQPEQSFEDRFRQNLAEYLHFITIHSGNLLDHSWSGEPIEILFLDICKAPELHDHATRMWFPSLIPGRSIVIQQDYGWRRYHWGNVMMEVFKDHFRILDEVSFGRVYLCQKAIPEDEAATRLYAHIAPDEKLQHMQAAVASASDLHWRVNLLFSYALLTESLGRHNLTKETLRLILCLGEQLTDAPGDPVRATLAEFPQYFIGPERLPLPAKLRRAPRPAAAQRRLPFLGRVRRELNRVLGRKSAA